MRMPCETCQKNKKCDLRADFMPKYFLSLLTGPPSCQEYEPAWYRGIEGCLQ